MLDRAPVTLSTLRTREDFFYGAVHESVSCNLKINRMFPRTRDECNDSLENLLLGECEQEFAAGCHELNPLKI